jgi:iron complex transport system ATP-binding protein
MSLVLESLTVGRGRPVLEGIDATVDVGQRVALLGANGAGKSTLLRVLAGLDAPLAGRVLLDGAPLPVGRARAGRLGVLLQSEPAPVMPVGHVVGLGLMRDGPAPPDRVADALREVDLLAHADRALDRLSGGEQRRAALARTWIARPRVLLLDEPTAHLDPGQAAAFHARLATLPATIVLATHDLALAASCDRVWLLAGGRLLADGSPDTVLTPAILAEALAIDVVRIADPDGGPPLFRVRGPRRVA